MQTFEIFLQVQNWLTLFILIGLEIILGIDNLFVLLLFSNQLSGVQRHWARVLGLFLALFIRILLLAFAYKLATLQDPIFYIESHGVSIRHILFFLGGLFLIASTINELRKKHSPPVCIKPKTSYFGIVVLQIVFFDFLFSFDSVITAIGVTPYYWLVVIAVIASMLIVLAASRFLADLLQKYPRLTFVALYFLLLIGIILMVEGGGVHVPTYYVLVALGGAILLELARYLYCCLSYHP